MLGVNDPLLLFDVNRVAWARRNFRKMSDARTSSFLLSLAFLFLLFNAMRRDVTQYLTSAYETRKDDVYTRADGRTRNVFLQDAVMLSSRKLSLFCDPIHPSLLPTPRDSVLYPRGGQPLLFIPYPLFFILYIPVYLGRQTPVPRMA